MNLENALKIAVRAARALAQIHDDGVVHLAVTPWTALPDGEGDIDLARSARRERAAIAGAAGGPGVPAESLPYISPEQTGRMSRPVDYRSDLYSLGVVLYELISGVLPLSAATPAEWLHCHIARPPRPLREVAPRVPRAVSDVIMRLLAKVPDERYQSARGLARDLSQCLEALEATGKIETFPPGAEDIPERLRIPARLYARGDERAALLAAFERVAAAGAPELALISGYSGIGKSSLVDEVHRPITAGRGLFLAGKFEESKRDIPYFTIVQAFRDLVRHILSEDEATLDAWRQRLLASLGANGRLVIDVIPQVELIIGEQPPVPPLPHSEAQHRSQEVLRSFIGVFASRERPLAIFLDDLQWADFASTRLLSHLLTHPETRHVLILGAYRDAELEPNHPWLGALDEIRAARVPVTSISLGPLPLESLRELVADTFHCDAARAEPLADLVHAKTGGNPFFGIQFLKTLDQERLVRFDPAAPGWTWDIEEIRAKNFTDNVVELMIGKIEPLGARTRAALELAACLGSEVDASILADALGQPLARTQDDLAEAAAAGLVVLRGGSCRFLHDRVQEAAYSLIPEDQRAATHLRIARLLLERSPGAALEGHLFDVANHFNAGAAMLSGDERRRAAALNLQAGRRARASAAYRSATRYLSAGVALLPDDAWDAEYAVAFGLHLGLAECTHGSGDFGEAERLAAEVIARARTHADKAAAYLVLIKSHVSRSAIGVGVDLGIECLRLFGIELSVHPSKEDVLERYHRIREALEGREIEDLLDLPLLTDPDTAVALEVLTEIYWSAFYVDPNLSDLVVCHAVLTSIRRGNAPGSAIGYVTFGMALCRIFGEQRDGYRFGKLAFDLTEKHRFTAVKTQVCMCLGSMITIWTHPLRTSLEYCRIGLQAALETGNHLYTAFHALQLSLALFIQGEPLESAYEAAGRYLELSRSAKLSFISDNILGIQRVIQGLRGLTDGLSTYSGDGFDQEAFEERLRATGFPVTRCYYETLKLQTLFMAGDHEGALRAADAAKEVLWAVDGQPPLPEYTYYAALAAAARFDVCPEGERDDLRRRMVEHREKLRAWAEVCPENYLGKHALVAAEIARVEGRDWEAAKLYEKSIRACRKNGLLQNEAIACELAARFSRAHGLASGAAAYLREAHHCFASWGAAGKVRQLEARHPELLGPTAQTHAAMLEAGVGQLDTKAILVASQALSSEIVLSDLLATLMRLVIEHAGADRCCVLMPRGGGVDLAAEARSAERGVDVRLPGSGTAATSAHVPLTLVSYVRRAREQVILDDAAEGTSYSTDEYIARVRPRSVLCVPIVRRAEQVAVLYAENSLATGAFTPRRTTTLELLAAQAAISLENAALYDSLARENTDRKRAEEALQEQIRLIEEQRDAIRVLSTPIIEVWEGVLTLPLFGAIDRYRAEQMIEVLLHAVVRNRCRYALIDLTGVDVVDASTAEHIVRLVKSVQMLGSRGIVVGIRPEVALAILSIGVDLSSILTLASLREALRWCMKDQSQRDQATRSGTARRP